MFFCLGAIIFASGQEQQAQKLLSEAIYQEEVNGKLDEAIKTYQLILKQYPDNRKVSAKALLRLGMCYEKLGSEQAANTYRQLIKEYADNKDEVSVARERLAGLEQILNGLKNKPTFRKIEIPTRPDNGVLSPDGKMLALTSDNSVWMVPLQGNVGDNIAGEPVRIAEIPGVSSINNMLAWSADGRYIAVNSWANQEEAVHIIPLKGGNQHKIILPERGSLSFSEHLSLSSDGETLAFSALEPGVIPKNRKLDVLKIFTIPTRGGNPSQLSTGHGTLPYFSPDGNHIGYVNIYEKKVTQENSMPLYESELWMANSSGGSSVKLAVADGALKGPVWSPDGKNIAFVTRKMISIYPISQDRTKVGEPVNVSLPGYSAGLLAGWTPSNEIGVFILSESRSGIYTVPSSGGQAMQVTPVADSWHPRWSPDGKRIILEWHNDSEEIPVQLAYVPASGGKVTNIPWPDVTLMPAVPGSGHNLSPDGRKVVINAAEKPYTSDQLLDLWVIPMEDGHSLRLTNDDSFEMYPCWSPDGNWIAFTVWHKSSDVKGFDAIYKIPARGGEPVQITSAEDTVGRGSIAFTPDGKRIAFFSGKNIRTISVEGGKTEVLLSGVKFDYMSRIVMSADGFKLAYSDGNRRIWIADLSTGQKVMLKTGLPENYYVQDFDWSPDNQKFTFRAYTGTELEFWLVSNFLPQVKNP